VEIPAFDFRFVELFHELYALEDFISSVESQLPDLIKREEEKAINMLKEKGYENDSIERNEVEQRLYELIEEVLPRYFRSPLLVTLWAILESGLIEIAREVKDQQDQPIKLNDIRGDVLERSDKYFNHVLKLNLNTEDESWKHLQMFCVLRNALAHANGRVDSIKNEKERDKIRIWTKDDIGISETRGVLVFTSEFVRKTYRIVFEVIKNLTDQVTTEYPKPIHW
jgi:hypothetical protein